MSDAVSPSVPHAEAQELARRILRGIARPVSSGRGQPRWELVARITALPAADAMQVCRWAGLDPNDRVVRR